MNNLIVALDEGLLQCLRIHEGLAIETKLKDLEFFWNLKLAPFWHACELAFYLSQFS